MAMFVVKSIHIQINSQVMDLSMAQRAHGVYTVLLATAQRTPWRSEILFL